MPTRREIPLGGLFNSLAQNRTPEGKAYAMSNSTVDDHTVKCAKRYMSLGSRPGASASDVCYGLGYGKFNCNETQTLQITGSPTSGTVVLTWNTDTSALNYNSSAADVQAALEALASVNAGEVTCTGGPWPNEPIYATFKGRYAHATQTLIALKTNALGGGSSPSLSISRLVTGGSHEEYLVVVQPSGSGTCTLYSVTSSDGYATSAGLTWTSVATGIAASDWFFLQYKDKIYASNVSTGLLYKRLGGAWSGIGGISGVRDPFEAPTGIPYSSYTGTYLTAFNWKTGGSASVGSFSGWGSDPTIALSASGDYIKFTLNAALSNDTVSCVVTLFGNEDHSTQDYWRMQVISAPSEISMLPQNFGFSEVNADGSPVTLTPQFEDAGVLSEGASSAFYIKSFHFGKKDRTLRDNIHKINLTLAVAAGTSAKSFYLRLYPMDTWPNDRMATLDIVGGATLRGIEYAYSYFKISTGEESKLSPGGVGQSVPDAVNSGRHVQVRCRGSTELTTSDLVKVYRKDRFGLWRFIGSTANSTTGYVTYVDTNMLDELDAYPVFGQITLPGGFYPEFIARWKQCMVIASDQKTWLSYVGNPLIYAPDSDDFAAQATLDIADPNIPRTDYMSDTRSEDVIGIVGQDSLYLAGPSTSYAMTAGDRPNDLSPPRALPGSRGCMGYRAATQLSGGALMAYRDGLWYYAVSPGFAGTVQSGTIIEEEMSKDIRTTWNDIFGASPSNAILAVFDEEIYCIAGADYIKFTRNKEIESGTFTDSVKALVPSQANGLIFATTKGELMKFGNYTTDAGEAVAFSYETGILQGERKRISGIEVHYQGRPAVKIECWDGLGGYDFQRFDMEPFSANGAPTVNYDMAGIPIQGYRFRITLYGTGDDVIESLAIFYDDASQGGAGN